MKTIWNFISENWDVISPILYGLVLEIALRLWPTKNNISIIDNLWKLFNKVIPNIRVANEKDEIIEPSIFPGNGSPLTKQQRKQRRNRVLLNVARHVLGGLVITILLNVSVHAQLYSTSKGVGYINADSTTARYNANLLNSQYGPAGYLYFNKQSNKWRIFYDSTWHDLIQNAASGAFWPLAGSASQTAPVTINSGAHNFLWNGTTGDFTVNTTDFIANGATIALNGEWPFILMNGSVGTGQAEISADITQTNHLVLSEVNGITLESLTGPLNFTATTDIVNTGINLSNSFTGNYSYVNGGSTGSFSIGDGLDDPATISFTSTTDLILSSGNIVASLGGNTGLLGQALMSNGAGGLTWATPAGGTPGGADTQVQFNNAGAFGGDSDFTFLTDRATMTNATVTTNLRVSNLTSGRVTMAGTVGALQDDADLTFSTDQLTIGNPAGARVLADGDAVPSVKIIAGGNTTSYNQNDIVPAGAFAIQSSNGSINIAALSLAGSDVVLQAVDDVSIDPANSLLMRSGANKITGTATLVGGTVTVNNTLITANTHIFLTVQATGGTQGFLSTTRVASTSFTINSTSGTDTSTIAWLLIEPF